MWAVRVIYVGCEGDLGVEHVSKVQPDLGPRPNRHCCGWITSPDVKLCSFKYGFPQME